MLNFEKEQKIFQVGNVKIGGQPGENPIVMVGTVFYAKHAALLNEKSGKFDKDIVETEVNEFIEIIEEAGMQAIREKMKDLNKIENKHFEAALEKINSTLPVDIIEQYEKMSNDLIKSRNIKESREDLYR